MHRRIPALVVLLTLAAVAALGVGASTALATGFACPVDGFQGPPVFSGGVRVTELTTCNKDYFVLTTPLYENGGTWHVAAPFKCFGKNGLTACAGLPASAEYAAGSHHENDVTFNGIVDANTGASLAPYCQYNWKVQVFPEHIVSPGNNEEIPGHNSGVLNKTC